jgi:hypothetical protein
MRRPNVDELAEGLIPNEILDMGWAEDFEFREVEGERPVYQRLVESCKQLIAAEKVFSARPKEGE